jgi:hypothetical protein
VAQGCGLRRARPVGEGAAARELAPRVLIPMHVGCPERLDVYERFRGEPQVVAPSRLGQKFQYQDGRVAVQ